MTPRTDHPISEHLAWAQWWAFPWQYAHQDWIDDDYPAIAALYHNERRVPGNFAGVPACLPPAPHPTVLRLALATPDQLSLAMTLVHDTFNPDAAAALSENHHQWCIRLSKAMPPDMLLPDADPLQLLHRWVDPSIWQRLRLRFPHQRVCEVEKKICSLENAHSRLNTLWQAVVWRVTTMTSDTLSPGSKG